MTPPSTTSPFSTADADRNLSLGDQLLRDWKATADLQHFGEVGPVYAARKAEWDRIRPMLAQAPAMRSLLDEANVAWFERFAADEDINGEDLVEWFAQWLPRVQETLGQIMQAEAIVPAPVRLNVPGRPL